MTNGKPQQPVPQVVYATFAGTIDAPGLNRIFTGIAVASQNGVKTVKLAFQSTGGFVSDGVALYNFFRGCPVQLELYNIGGVASVAAVAFLGATKKYASAQATFMFHRTYSTPPQGEAPLLRSIADGLVIDNERTEAIIRSHLNLPEDRWTNMTGGQLHMTANDALQCGLIDAVQDFKVPMGERVFSI
jgi:ATP-dependent Clp protease protease subunit